MGSAKMQVEEASRSGKIVFEMENVNYQVDGKVLVKDFSAQIQRGDKIALIGPNGCGKTTLLKLMLGQLQADSGGSMLAPSWRSPTSTSTARSWIRIKR